MFQSIIRTPDYIILNNQELKHKVKVLFENEKSYLSVYVQAQNVELKNIKLRWNVYIPVDSKFLSDAWERSYGDLEWRGLCADRVMPWYFLINRDNKNVGYGVKVRPNAFCYWQVDEIGITLNLDVRNGTKGVILNGKLKICDVVYENNENVDVFDFAKYFCTKMCDDPILPKEPVYGFNNWYYAYGDISEKSVIEDTDYLSKLVDQKIDNRPFMVIDDGWQVAHKINEYNGGPWNKGNEKFPDMKKLAKEISDRGCKPGIWVRLLHTSDDNLPKEWRLSRDFQILDPSVPEVLDYIKNIISDIVDWGYKIIKHDFSTFDIFDAWGFQMNDNVAKGDWCFYDRTKTTAQIIKEFYKAILDATNDSCYILGCNCIGHLGAGLMHMQRIGDDVSGFCWERTRKYGINTLAFRLPQHKTFFDIDADCVGVKSMKDLPWEYNRQWADLVAKSSTPLFISAKIKDLSKEVQEELKELLLKNSKQEDIVKPIDWLYTKCPSKWEINGEIKKYNWYEKTGISGFEV